MPVSQPVTDACGISVAMAAYNAAVYLPAQLDGVARQTLLPPNLSSAITLRPMTQFPYSKLSPTVLPFRYTFTETCPTFGVLNNFMRAFSLCSNPFIAYCDADDVWAPEKLAKCFAASGSRASCSFLTTAA